MNCSACKYMQRITKNKAARCFKHGFQTLLRRYDKTNPPYIAEKKLEPIKIKGRIYYV